MVFILLFFVIFVNVFMLQFRVFTFTISLVKSVIFWVGLSMVYRFNFNMYVIKFICCSLLLSEKIFINFDFTYQKSYLSVVIVAFTSCSL